MMKTPNLPLLGQLLLLVFIVVCPKTCSAFVVVAPHQQRFSSSSGTCLPSSSSSSSASSTTNSKEEKEKKTMTMKKMFEPQVPNFCADCGHDKMVLKIPEGDERLRAVCENCGRIEYSNPKIVAACVVRTTPEDEDDAQVRTLMGKRAIEPRKGTWGIPQGYMEHGETTRQAAVREVWEETGVILDPATLKFRAVYNVPGSVQLVYEAKADAATLQGQIDAYNDNKKDGGESLEVALLSGKDLEEKEICFPTVQWALDHCQSQPEQDVPSNIQQMTKFYDPETEVWSQFQDEA